MNDFLEVLDFCAFDVDKAVEMTKEYCTIDVIKETLNEIGLERMEPEPD